MEAVHCHSCGSERFSEVLRQRDLIEKIASDEFSIVRCANCELMFLSPRPTSQEIGRYYPPQYFAAPSRHRAPSRIKRWIMEDFYGYPSTHAGSAYVLVRKALLFPEWFRRVAAGREVLPYIGSGRLLDVGCGTGVNLRSFQAQGWEVLGVELSQSAASHARSLVGNRVFTGTLERAPFKAESFDVIVFSHSLEHLFDPSEAVTHASRLLKREGLLVIVVPNAGGWEARLFGSHWVQWDAPRHLYHFEFPTLCRLIERAGFSIQRLRTGVGTAFFMASLERFWAYKFGGRLPARKIIEMLVARPFCFLAGHLGRGTEMTVYATKICQS